MNSPKISIIIPLYNSENRVAKTLMSIKNQTYKDWECIIIDDGSTDQSREIVLSSIKDDSRFRLLDRTLISEIKGANICRNIGIKYSVCPFLMFIDSDDTIKNNCLETRMFEIDAKPGFDFYLFNTVFVNNEEKITGKFKISKQSISDLIVKLIVNEIPWHTMSPIWKKNFLDAIGGWNNNYERLQDVELNIRALLAKPKIYYTNSQEPDTFYFESGSSEQKVKAIKRAYCRLVKDYFKLLQSCNLLSLAKKRKVTRVLEYYLEEQITNYIRYAKEKDSLLETLIIETLKETEVEAEIVKKVYELFCKKSFVKIQI